MKYALIIPDGCADEPQPSLGGRTPLEAAHIPHMNAIARRGMVGQADHVPASLPSGSDVGTMNLFGYDPLKYHTGRAPIEAAAQGIPLGPDDWAIRCNLVTIENERMRSFTAGQIPSQLGRELIELMQRDQPSATPWEFHAGVSYRNLLIYRGKNGAAPFASSTYTVPPHDITDQLVETSLPRGPGSEALRSLMQRSEKLLAESENNRARSSRGELPATSIWLWGLGKTPALPKFIDRFGKSGAVITAVDLLRGLARLLGWGVVEVPGATGYLDTDYAAKGRYAIETLKSVDLVVVHVEATDEASHEGNAAEKVEALERIDRDIVGPVAAWLESHGAHRILVSPDHPTFCRTKTHSHGLVPFAMAGTGISTDAAISYNERSAVNSGIAIPGFELMPMFLRS